MAQGFVNRSLPAGGDTVSAAAPANPSEGDGWWDTSSGRAYVYYTDADGSQWVERTPTSANDADTEDRLPKAWVAFNGTGTVAIRDSNNVTSITDNATGDYTINFTTDMGDTEYMVLAYNDIGSSSSTSRWINQTARAVGSLRIVTRWSSTLEDQAYINVGIWSTA
jgi:hypothetical protein